MRDVNPELVPILEDDTRLSGPSDTWWRAIFAGQSSAQDLPSCEMMYPVRIRVPGSRVVP